MWSWHKKKIKTLAGSLVPLRSEKQSLLKRATVLSVSIPKHCEPRGGINQVFQIVQIQSLSLAICHNWSELSHGKIKFQKSFLLSEILQHLVMWKKNEKNQILTLKKKLQSYQNNFFRVTSFQLVTSIHNKK